MGKLNEGDKAPDFDTISSDEKKVALRALKGKKVILYFYPKDDTPGCTVEACGFRDKSGEIEAQGAVILGVSPDGVDSHKKFINKHSLPFTLLADEDKVISKAYGVWVKKNKYGKEYMGVARTTFVIDENGYIVKIYEKVKPEGHNDEIIAFLSGVS